MHCSSVYTIHPDQSFVDVLAATLWSEAEHDPMALASMRVLLPTRRACRALQDAFLRVSKGKPTLLPSLHPIGDLDEEELTFTALLGQPVQEESTLLPTLAPARRTLLLARLIWQFHQLEFGTAARMDMAVHLAEALLSFMDDVARYELSLDALAGLVPEELAKHWQITLNFLQIIVQQWPRILAEEGKSEPLERRNRLISLLAAHWQEKPPSYKIIAAGTTGSTPATASLLKVIAGMSHGRVILPGLDVDMPDAMWESVEETHPQYGMKQLLEFMEVERTHVLRMGDLETKDVNRHFWQEVLLPASHIDQWQKSHPLSDQTLATSFYVPAANVQEESITIAMMLREAIETPGKTAALITPNRALARRVSSVLKRFGIQIDDSAGKPHSHMVQGVLLRLVVEVAASKLAPAPLLALLKHPLVSLGLPTGECRYRARRLEEAILRGVRLSPGFAVLKGAVAERVRDHTLRAALYDLVERLEAALYPFMEAFAQDACDFEQLLMLHLGAAEQLSDGFVWENDEGSALAQSMQQLVEHAGVMGEVPPPSYPGLFTTLLAKNLYRPRYGMHPRLHILSPMEARLQQFDRVVLGGLNEGGWPQTMSIDPWMSRPMRTAFGLPLVERQIGLSAHDFFLQAVSAKELFLTRSEKEGGTPTVASRWLLRLDALLRAKGGDDAVNRWNTKGKFWLDYARGWDRPDSVSPLLPPAPTPPLAARPTLFYVTHIQTLMRDPYGVYAAQILRLKKLQPIDKEPDKAELGSLIHLAIERYVKECSLHASIAEREMLLQKTGKEAFASLLDRPAVEAFWWPRYLRIAKWVAEEDFNRSHAIKQVFAEVNGQWNLRVGERDFTLKARMDRVEIYSDGTLKIIDYKTGAIPKKGDMIKAIACQMPLEGMMAMAGGIEGVGTTKPSNMALEFWKLKGGNPAGEISDIAKMIDELSLVDLLERVREEVTSVLAAYEEESLPYLACPNPDNTPDYNDYEHLERLKEWGGEV